MICRNCKKENHPSYDRRYGGYCLDCFNARVPDLQDRIEQLEDRIQQLEEENWGLKEKLEGHQERQ